MRVLAIGEILWDVFGADERLGGAPLNVVVHAARLGHETAIVSGLGADSRGERARAAVLAAGVSDRFIRTIPDAPTGTAHVRLDDGGTPTYDIPRPAAYDLVGLDSADLAALAAAAADWRPDWIVSGTLAQGGPAVHDLTASILASCPTAMTLCDINLRDGAYTPALVLACMERADVVKLSHDEAAVVAGLLGLASDPLEPFARALAERAGARGVCITSGAHGAALLLDGTWATASAVPVEVVDTVGAGDSFSAALIHGIHASESPPDVLDRATRVAALVAARPGATPPWTLAEAADLHPVRSDHAHQ